METQDFQNKMGSKKRHRHDNTSLTQETERGSERGRGHRGERETQGEPT